MSPTLWDKNWTLVNRQAKEPSYGDIVVITIEGQWIVKRVMGMAGDVMDVMQDGTVLRNGVVIADDWAVKSFLPCDISLPAAVPKGTLFLLGDNRAHSVDSRSEAVGMVSMDQYIGTLWYVLEQNVRDNERIE